MSIGSKRRFPRIVLQPLSSGLVLGAGEIAGKAVVMLRIISLGRVIATIV